MRFCTSESGGFCISDPTSGFLADIKIKPVECPIFALFLSHLSHGKIKPVILRDLSSLTSAHLGLYR